MQINIINSTESVVVVFFIIIVHVHMGAQAVLQIPEVAQSAECSNIVCLVWTSNLLVESWTWKLLQGFFFSHLRKEIETIADVVTVFSVNLK